MASLDDIFRKPVQGLLDITHYDSQFWVPIQTSFLSQFHKELDYDWTIHSADGRQWKFKTWRMHTFSNGGFITAGGILEGWGDFKYAMQLKDSQRLRFLYVGDSTFRVDIRMPGSKGRVNMESWDIPDEPAEDVADSMY